MGNVLSKITNTLEVYLNDVFEKECDIKATEEETEFIREGIEEFVRIIVDGVLELLPRYDTFEKCFKVENASEKDRLFQEHLLQVNFPLKTGPEYVDAQKARSPVINVGSFYDGTKNNFPDEFDYIYLMFTVIHKPGSFDLRVVDYPRFSLLNQTLIKEVASCINITKHKLLPRTLPSHEKMELFFHRFVKMHGPATMLEFIYKNERGVARSIHVDLAPAFRVIIDNRNKAWNEEYLERHVEPESFLKEVMTARQYLFVNYSTSLIETEMYFMKNVLSKKHVQVYRILKYLINGHGDSETLVQFLGKMKDEQEMKEDGPNIRGKGYSSYDIKTMIFFHHEDCENPDSKDISCCIIQVLDAMGEIKHSLEYPNLYRFEINVLELMLARWMNLHSYIVLLVKSLKAMRNESNGYNYEDIGLKSVTRQYLESLDRDDPCKWSKFLDKLKDNTPSYGVEPYRHSLDFLNK